MLLRTLSVSAMAALGMVFSCIEEERLTAADAAAISEEALTDSYFQDLDDLSSVAVAAPDDDQYENGGGRVATTITVNDDRFCELAVTIEPLEGSTQLHPKGKITVDFGSTGCTDPRGNVRTGKLFFEYDGPRFLAGSTVKITTDDYKINGILLEGTRTSTNVTGSNSEAPKFNVTLEDGKATFPNGAIATRESNITWSWVREANPTQDQLVIDDNSTANGTTTSGRSYHISLEEDLVYTRSCFIAVDGIKNYTIDGTKQILIDYGSGDCNSVAVTVNGVTRNIKVY